MKALAAWVTALLALVVLAVPALGREEIRAFASDVTLRTDGSVRVIETVDVNAEGLDIRRGIYRDIPTVLQGPSGNKIRVGLEVESVTRDGNAEMFRTERMGNFQRIWIGDPDQFIDRGVHRFVITYTMDRMARPFETYDELYWNATGNYWNFPILRSVARVTLPEGAVIENMSAFTGDVGSTETAVTITPTSDNQATFRTQRELGPGEGMSFAVSFQKGIIAFPTGVDALVQEASDLREVWLPVVAVLLLLLYNFGAWIRVGRDPPKGTIIPLFHPPKNFSPALTHYVHKWGFANSGWTAMTAAIFDLGVKGLVTIKNTDDGLTVQATGKAPDAPLPVGEEVLNRYFSSQGEVTVGKSTGVELARQRSEFMSAIQRENQKIWFNHNFGFAALSVVLTILMLVGMVALDVLEPVWLIVAFVGGIFAAVVGSIIFSVMKQGGWQRYLTLAIIGIFGFNFVAGMLETFSGVTINSAALAAGSMVLITAIFAVLMRAPTVQGRKVMDEIEGFKLYLDTAEKERLNMTAEPPMTVERFEKILPYAIALGVEKPWSEHFESELARNAVSDVSSTGYNPYWYSGGSRGFSPGSISNTVSAATTGMAAAMIAAQPVQASSSGSSGGGGGFSGGGGGGGGGGGW
ncbi:hypothetical protein ASG47_04825 [Devosia sp. Leaf420]|uniref:DUF2207 domain-containing protein n=1 Tax=Devosia sp. Leaf420 TaxID=1736374 RepID=UPI0007123ED0|nr:DUF2207 domain-containing protein [Devosia sp. Leaf420]KQT49642.1 hypothetical protein ASG47_04825 [Devosia sp. Leaf420]